MFCREGFTKSNIPSGFNHIEGAFFELSRKILPVFGQILSHCRIRRTDNRPQMFDLVTCFLTWHGA